MTAVVVILLPRSFVIMHLEHIIFVELVEVFVLVEAAAYG